MCVGDTVCKKIISIYVNIYVYICLSLQKLISFSNLLNLSKCTQFFTIQSKAQFVDYFKIFQRVKFDLPGYNVVSVVGEPENKYKLVSNNLQKFVDSSVCIDNIRKLKLTWQVLFQVYESSNLMPGGRMDEHGYVSR